MTTAAAKKKTADEPESTVAHPLLAVPVPHAYALIPDPNRVGRFFAVHLTDVLAKGLEHLEPSGRSEAAAYGLQRMDRAMDRRHKEKRWKD